MAESKTLDSNSKGNWVEDNVLTKIVFDEDNLEIYERIINNYSRKLSEFGKDTNEKLVYTLRKYSELKQGTNEDNIFEQLPELNFPKLYPSHDILNSKKYYKKVQNWQGVVTEIRGESFKARLDDLTSGGTNELVEFDKEEVSPSDFHLLHEGALFYWSVGRYMENGQSVNRSDIRFQRLITLNEDDINQATDNVEKNYSNLKERKIDRPTT